MSSKYPFNNSKLANKIIHNNNKCNNMGRHFNKINKI